MITPSIDHWCCWVQAVIGPLAASFTLFSATLNLDSSTLTWGDAQAPTFPAGEKLAYLIKSIRLTSRAFSEEANSAKSQRNLRLHLQTRMVSFGK